MPVEVLTMSEQEQEVIETAIRFCQTRRNGLFHDIAARQEDLEAAVEMLLMECDGRWPE